MARVLTLGATALCLVRLACSGRPARQDDLLDPLASGVRVQAKGALVSLQRGREVLNQDVDLVTPRAVQPHGGADPVSSSLLQRGLDPEEAESKKLDEEEAAPAAVQGLDPAPAAVQGLDPAPAAVQRSAYKITDDKFRPKVPAEADLPTKKVAGDTQNQYDRVKDLLINEEKLVFSPEFDVSKFAEAGHDSFVKNDLYHDALQKYTDSLVKMSGGAKGITEKEYNTHVEITKDIQNQLSSGAANIDVNRGLPPAATPAAQPAAQPAALPAAQPAAQPATPAAQPAAIAAAGGHKFVHPTYGDITTESECNGEGLEAKAKERNPAATGPYKLSGSNKADCVACLAVDDSSGTAGRQDQCQAL